MRERRLKCRCRVSKRRHVAREFGAASEAKAHLSRTIARAVPLRLRPLLSGYMRSVSYTHLTLPTILLV